MAKKYKTKKRARYRSGKKVERLDMRKGGRVRYQTGGPKGPMERDIREVPEEGSQDSDSRLGDYRVVSKKSELSDFTQTIV